MTISDIKVKATQFLSGLLLLTIIAPNIINFSCNDQT